MSWQLAREQFRLQWFGRKKLRSGSGGARKFKTALKLGSGLGDDRPDEQRLRKLKRRSVKARERVKMARKSARRPYIKDGPWLRELPVLLRTIPDSVSRRVLENPRFTKAQCLREPGLALKPRTLKTPTPYINSPYPAPPPEPQTP